MGGDSRSEGLSSNPSAIYWMDIFSQIFVVKILIFVWKDKNKWKKVGIGPFFKKINFYYKVNLVVVRGGYKKLWF